MPAYAVCRDLAIIILSAKAFGLLARRLHAPQVVGEILAGLVIGPCVLGWVAQSDFLSGVAEIGVILLMFCTGLDTDLSELKKTGGAALLIACVGVFVPLLLGTVLFCVYYGVAPGSSQFLHAVYIGTIMTATSVSITVEALREMGHLRGRVGTTIVSAAIIDDVIGIIVLTVVIGFKDPTVRPLTVLLRTVLFLLFAAAIWAVGARLFSYLDTVFEHTRRMTILSLGFCLIMAYLSEKLFGVADITGAYLAGIILCNIRDSGRIAKKMDINSYLIFGPVFFASIGLKTDLSALDLNILLFSLAFVAVALLSKVIGCGLAARCCRFRSCDSLKIGVGMMTRGEVALIVAQKGLSAGLLSSAYFTSVILLILVSSIATPLLLGAIYARWPDLDVPAEPAPAPAPAKPTA